jgi:hypothetical protein
LDCSLASEPREAFRCPARQPERLQSKTATPDCNERVQVHCERCRFKPSTLKAVFADEPPATWHAESDARKIRDVRRAFPAPIFSNCEVGKAGGVTGARRAERIYAAQYLMALSSEHGGGEGVAMREGTGAQGAPI